MALNRVYICTFIEAKQSAVEEVENLRKQVKDLQEKLSSQQSESRQALEDAQHAATRREQDLASRLSSLTRSVKGKQLNPIDTISFV